MDTDKTIQSQEGHEERPVYAMAAQTELTQQQLLTLQQRYEAWVEQVGANTSPTPVAGMTAKERAQAIILGRGKLNESIDKAKGVVTVEVGKIAEAQKLIERFQDAINYEIAQMETADLLEKLMDEARLVVSNAWPREIFEVTLRFWLEQVDLLEEGRVREYSSEEWKEIVDDFLSLAKEKAVVSESSSGNTIAIAAPEDIGVEGKKIDEISIPQDISTEPNAPSDETPAPIEKEGPRVVDANNGILIDGRYFILYTAGIIDEESKRRVRELMEMLLAKNTSEDSAISVAELVACMLNKDIRAMSAQEISSMMQKQRAWLISIENLKAMTTKDPEHNFAIHHGKKVRLSLIKGSSDPYSTIYLVNKAQQEAEGKKEEPVVTIRTFKEEAGVDEYDEDSNDDLPPAPAVEHNDSKIPELTGQYVQIALPKSLSRKGEEVLIRVPVDDANRLDRILLRLVESYKALPNARLWKTDEAKAVYSADANGPVAGPDIKLYEENISVLNEILSPFDVEISILPLTRGVESRKGGKFLPTTSRRGHAHVGKEETYLLRTKKQRQ